MRNRPSRKIFELILEWAVIPTFDLVLEVRGKGIIMVRRKIVPYKDQWALPGLRIYKGETINDTLRRIAKQELGIIIDPRKKILLGQYVGKFKTEHQRQDVSTGYLISLDQKTFRKIDYNKERFSEMRVAKNFPGRAGAMYSYYLKLWKTSSKN